MQVTLLQKLLKRGDKVAIANGNLVIQPKSGGHIPTDWYEQHHDKLVSQIIDLLDVECFVFDSFTTGRYGSKMYSGVTLRFESCAKGDLYYCVFNAETRYKNEPNKGKPLPNKRFRISKNSKLYKFLQRAGFAFPKRLSAIHDYMGNLKGILFIATVLDKEKLDKNSIAPLNVNCDQIKRLLCIKANNQQTSAKQFTYAFQTNTPNIDTASSEASQCIEPNKNTCKEKHDISNQDSTIQVPPLTAVYKEKRPEEQTTEEWLAEYDADSPYVSIN